jgi:hypothetical protein
VPSPSGASSSNGRTAAERLDSDVTYLTMFVPPAISEAGTSTRAAVAGAQQTSGSRPPFTPD